jgi:hypothetical protein
VAFEAHGKTVLKFTVYRPNGSPEQESAESSFINNYTAIWVVGSKNPETKGADCFRIFRNAIREAAALRAISPGA